ncbi:MAG: ATP-binding cassette domain-containing protein, partial [Bacteroidales bacterium]|nr:ATP-binding cassette domain-containing protein [Bacteroidales bacterium]
MTNFLEGGGALMLLEMNNISKTYGNVIANDDVSISIDKGEVLAIVGENGAGKSTIMKILYGLETPTLGKTYINGKEVKFKDPRDAIACGIGMVQQHFMLFDSLTVAENIVYSFEPRKRGLFFDREAAISRVKELSQKYGLDINPLGLTEACPVGLQQRIEILKVLHQNAEIIIFDEPSAVLTPQEVQQLLKTIRNLADMGKSIILITHKLHEVMEVADRAVIMRSGKKVGEMDIAEASIEKMSYMMVGRHIEKRKPKKYEPGERVLTIENLNYVDEAGKHAIKDLSMHVSSGEVVGIAGVSGNGQSELLHLIMGLEQAKDGRIMIGDKDITGKQVFDVRESGCACIPEDRYKHGCAAKADLVQTTLLGNQYKEQFAKKGILKANRIKQFTIDLFDRYSVKY